MCDTLGAQAFGVSPLLACAWHAQDGQRGWLVGWPWPQPRIPRRRGSRVALKDSADEGCDAGRNCEGHKHTTKLGWPVCLCRPASGLDG
jgi:hypothetical protein